MKRPAPRTLSATFSFPFRLPPAPVTARHVVVLDSDEFALRTLRLVLHNAGFRVSATWSVSDALGFVEEQRADAFVVSARVRTCDGLSVLRAPSVAKSGCLRVLLGFTGNVQDAMRAPDAPDIVLSKEEALTVLAKRLSDALDARRPETPEQAAALRLRARRIVAAVCRDGYEGMHHCERLAEWSRELATALGVPPSSVLDVELGAMLHDIGKLHVRDEVLNRAGPLTDREREQVQQHPLIGAELLRDVPELHRAIPVVLGHHEHLDGSGYPRGLAGEQIPLSARIVQVVDAYEAIVTGRPWRPALDHAAAVARMRERVGTQFDPTVFSAFERISPAWDARRRSDGAGRVAA